MEGWVENNRHESHVPTLLNMWETTLDGFRFPISVQVEKLDVVGPKGIYPNMGFCPPKS